MFLNLEVDCWIVSLRSWLDCCRIIVIRIFSNIFDNNPTMSEAKQSNNQSLKNFQSRHLGSDLTVVICVCSRTQSLLAHKVTNNFVEQICTKIFVKTNLSTKKIVEE